MVEIIQVPESDFRVFVHFEHHRCISYNMSRPSAVLLDAAYTASSSTARSAKSAPRPPRYSLNPLGSKSRRFVPDSHCKLPEYCQAYISAKQDRSQRTHHIVIADIPKTATPQDVLRALKQNNIVEKDFPISGSE